MNPTLNLWNDITKLADNFFSCLRPDKKVCLLYHGDADGCTSAVYLSYAIKKITAKLPDKIIWMSSLSYDLHQEKEMILVEKPQALIITDIDIVGSNQLQQEWLTQIPSVLIYDHHGISPETKIDVPFLYLNPHLTTETKYPPASFFGFEIARRFLPSTQLNEWVLATGLLADASLNDYPQVSEILNEKYRDLCLPVYNKNYSTKLQGIAYLLNAGFFYNPQKRSNLSFEVLSCAFELEDPEYIFETKFPHPAMLHQIQQELEKEIKIQLASALKQEDIFHTDLPLFVYKMNTVHYVGGIVAAKLAHLYPHKIILISQEGQDTISIEVRVGQDLPMDSNQIFYQQKKLFQCLSSGGHPRAGGALIKKEQYQVFLQTYISTLQRLLKEM